MLLLLFLLSQQPAPPAAPAVITGRVINAVTQQPVRGALVGIGSVTPEGVDDRFVSLTGADGRFVLRGVKPRTVALTVMKLGYVTRRFSSQRAIAADEGMERVELPIWPGASISGTVVDNGVPLAGVLVTATPVTATPGEQALFGSDTQVRTDDDGSYSLAGLMAGDYVISGHWGRRGRTTMTSASITVGIGEGRSGVNLARTRSGDDVEADSGREPLTGRGSGMIAGRVVDANGRGLTHVEVTLQYTGPKSSGASAVTDASGQFRFSGLPEGPFMITAERYGYFADSGSRGGSGSSAPVVQLTNGGRQEDLVLTLRRGSVITGTVVDEYGDPILALVNATRLGVSRLGISGAREVQGQNMAVVARVNARGRYRIGPLPAGEYQLLVEPAVSETMLHVEDASGALRKVAMLPYVFPGTITLVDDRDVSGVDIVIAPVAATAIDITIESDGQRVSEAELEVEHLSAQARSASPRIVKVTGGKTRIQPVRAGRYRLVAATHRSGSGAYGHMRRWAVTDVTVADFTPAVVTMVLQPGARISGRVVQEDGAKQAQPAIAVRLVPLEGTVSGAGGSPMQEAAGAFSIDGILPGTYALEPTTPPNSRYAWTPKSAMHQGRDLFDVPVELGPGTELTDIVVTLTDRISELSGTVTDSKGRPAADAEIIVFSSDARFWWAGSRRVRRALPDATGRYALYGLPSGEYLVAVMRHKGESDLLALLGSLQSTAARVTLAEGGQAQQNIMIR